MTRAFTVVLIGIIAMVWIAGCQEEQASSGDQMARLTALENRETRAKLQAEIKNRDDEIQNLKDKTKKQDDEIKNLADRLSLCEKARDAKTEEIQKELADRYMGMIADLAKKNSELTTEVDQLKAEAAKAKGEK